MNWERKMILCCVACVAMACAAADSVAHRFLYSDFMNRKVVYVDEANRNAYKEVFLPEVAFDIMRCGPNRLVVAQRHGCRLYDIEKLRLISEIKDPEHLKYATSVTRLADGRTFILDGPAILESSQDGKWIR